MKKLIKLFVTTLLLLLMVLTVSSSAMAAPPAPEPESQAAIISGESEALVSSADVSAGVEELPIGQLLLLALFIETIVNFLKPIWDKTAARITTAEIVSMCLGVLLAVVAKFNMMAGFVPVTSVVLLYILYIMTGVALGRGPSLLYDLWKKLKAQQAS